MLFYMPALRCFEFVFNLTLLIILFVADIKGEALVAEQLMDL